MSDEKVVLKNTIRVLDGGQRESSASSEGAAILAGWPV